MFDMDALAKALFVVDWPHDAEAKWAKHLELQDLAYRRYVRLAETAFNFIRN